MGEIEALKAMMKWASADVQVRFSFMRYNPEYRYILPRMCMRCSRTTAGRLTASGRLYHLLVINLNMIFLLVMAL